MAKRSSVWKRSATSNTGCEQVDAADELKIP
jgi:hypothetical protein